MGFTFREDKGSDLTPDEVDSNFREVASIRDFAADRADQAAASANSASASASTAAQQAGIAKNEADRAEVIASTLEISGDIAELAGTIAALPKTKPALNLDFINQKQLLPMVEFTRASTDWDSQGREYEINEPVLTDEGLWVSGARTNLVAGSYNFDLWPVKGSAFSGSGDVYSVTFQEGAPARGLTRVSVPLPSGRYRVHFDFTILDSSGDIDGIYIGESLATPANANRSYIHFHFFSGDVTALGTFPPENIKVNKVGDKRYIIEFIYEVAEDGSTKEINITLSTVDGLQTEVAYNVLKMHNLTVVSADEPLLGPIPTNGSQVTVASSPTLLNVELDRNKGAIVCAFNVPDTSELERRCVFTAGLDGDSEQISLYFHATTKRLTLRLRSLGVDFVHSPLGTYEEGEEIVAAISWDGTSVRATINGVIVLTSLYTSFPNVSSMWLGSYSGTIRFLNQNIKSLIVFDKVLTDEQLQELTTL